MMKKAMAVLTGLCMTATAFAAPVLINGAGATFPYPIYSKWFDEYSKINGDVRFNYQSIGSGGGIKQVTAKTVDFGASDGPMSDQQLAEAPGRLFHIPTVMGAVAVAYNVPGVSKGLKLTAQALSGIYMGEITKWNDPKIASENPDAQLPDSPILVVRRSDGSGTTFIFTDYLSSVHGGWKLKVGKGTSVNWPVGLGGKGNEGVAGLIKQTPGSIGYIELSYAIKNGLDHAFLQNKSGAFVEPSIASTSKAAEGVEIPSDFRVSIVNSANAEAYPIAGFTWLLVYKTNDDPVKGKAIAEFLDWAMADGQKYAPELLYAPLPANVVEMVKKKIQDLK